MDLHWLHVALVDLLYRRRSVGRDANITPHGQFLLGHSPSDTFPSVQGVNVLQSLGPTRDCDKVGGRGVATG